MYGQYIHCTCTFDYFLPKVIFNVLKTSFEFLQPGTRNDNLWDSYLSFGSPWQFLGTFVCMLLYLQLLNKPKKQ